jgi:TonB family protein
MACTFALRPDSGKPNCALHHQLTAPIAFYTLSDAMDERFRKYLKRSTIGHGIVLLLIIIVPAIVNWRIHRKNMESITFVDFTVALPGDTSVAPTKDFTEPKALDKAPPKDLITEPSPDKAGHKIQKSTKKIKRPQGGTVAKSNLSADEIRRLLAAGARISDHTSIPMGDLWEAGYYNHVHEMMYRVWNQPMSLSANAGMSAEVLIRVQRDGTIVSREMVRSSGNTLMDESVMKAVQSVTKLKALPTQFSGSTKDIRILFELTRGGM